MSLTCLFFRGLLFEKLPNPSNKALTSTPSFTFSARMSKRSEATESFLKLKYSRCTLLCACLMAQNISSNFSCPFIRSVMLLLSEKLIPFSLSCISIRESEATCAFTPFRHVRNEIATVINLLYADIILIKF